MELLIRKVVAVEDGQGTLSDAVNKALQYWVSHVDDTHYLLGSALGPDHSQRFVEISECDW